MNRSLPVLNLISPLEDIISSKWENDDAIVVKIRENGKSEFVKNGIPTTKVEEWKYTDLTKLTEINFQFDPESSHEVDAEVINAILPKKISSYSIVFINGKYSAKYSDIPTIQGLYIENIRNIIDSGDTNILKHMGNIDNTSDLMVNLNRAYLNDGFVIKTDKDINLEFPIHIIFLTTKSNSPKMTHPVNLIIAEEGSKLSIIEEFTGEPDLLYFSNPATEIILKKGAMVNHFKIQTESTSSFHISSLNVKQEENTKFSSQSASFGGALTRNNISSKLDGIESSCIIEGIYSLKGDQHLDNHTTIFHNSPFCKSSEEFNGILDGKSKAIFDGMVYVGKDSVQTDSYQSNRSLLISDSASVNSKPTLEIYSDDVKCSHSASVGQLDSDSLFYLRSRGIGENEAMKILTSAFLEKILERFSNNKVSDKIGKLLNNEMKNENSEQ